MIMDCNRCHEKHQVSKMDTNEVSMCVYVGGGIITEGGDM